MSPEELVAAARAWQDDDPDPSDRAELDQLIAAGDVDELRDRFGAHLEFGTAGLRGAMGAGPNRMNRAVVIRATAGLAAYVRDRGEAGRPVVVGYDARHRSAQFASDAAAVFAAAGFPVRLADSPLPTPVVAFGVRHLGCCAGVVITASHNPPQDNGYKVYLADGAQIAPPVDAGISAAIDAVGSVASVPRAPAGDPLVTPVGPDLVDAYVTAAVEMVVGPDPGGRSAPDSGGGSDPDSPRRARLAILADGTVRRVPPPAPPPPGGGRAGPQVPGAGRFGRSGPPVPGAGRLGRPGPPLPGAGAGRPGLRVPGDAVVARRADVGVVYTPLHGVGRDVVLRVFERAGFRAPYVVAEQGDPDPDFPTVAFPNPEEPGALDLALAAARQPRPSGRGAVDVVLANDPDADRLAVAIPEPGGDDRRWRALTGDEIGIVLADWLLAHGTGADRLVVTTVVSSSMLGRLAAARGVAFAETLTGFKWIARAALERPDLRFVYGYEEALGSCVGPLVRDKDGITAALAFADLVAFEKARGRGVADRLDDLARELGVHATGQRSIRFEGIDGLDRMRAAVDRLAADPPAALAGRPVTDVEDLRLGRRLPPTEGVLLRAGGLRMIVRPSGTEPKLKCYAEAVVPVVPVGAGTDLATARRQGRATVDQLLSDIAFLGPA